MAYKDASFALPESILVRGVRPEAKVRPHSTTEALRSVGMRVKEIPFAPPKNRDEEHVFVENNPGVFRRFATPVIDRFQALKPGIAAVAKEWLAGLLPYLDVIPIEQQRKIENALRNAGTVPKGFEVDVEGVVMQQLYTSTRIAEMTGIDPYLSHPDIGVHIYDAHGMFDKKINMHFITAKEAGRIDAINAHVNHLPPEQRSEFANRIMRMYSAWEEDGIAERIIHNPKSIGALGTLRGIPILDAYEIAMKYDSEKAWLTDSRTDLEGMNLSQHQRLILTKRKERYLRGKSIEGARITPTEEDILLQAIEKARSTGADPKLIQGLEHWLRDSLFGFSRYEHNIGRGSIFINPSHKEMENGKFVHFGKLDRILDSGRLIPYEGTYTKGTYLFGIDLSKDDPADFYQLVFGEAMKNVGNTPMILDIATPRMPQFKHQTCSVRYVPTDLHTELRRIIVGSEEHAQKVRSSSHLVEYQGVDVITTQQWFEEVTLIMEAKKEMELRL